MFWIKVQSIFFTPKKIWQIFTTAHFDRMRTVFLCLIVEVINDSAFSKWAKIMGILSLCIWFAFHLMLSFFSSQGHFYTSYLLILSGVTAGVLQSFTAEALREDFTEWRELFAGFTLETLQSREICRSLHYSLLWKFFKKRLKTKAKKIHYFISISTIQGALTRLISQYLFFFFSVKLFKSCFLLFAMCNDSKECLYVWKLLWLSFCWWTIKYLWLQKPSDMITNNQSLETRNNHFRSGCSYINRIMVYLAFVLVGFHAKAY